MVSELGDYLSRELPDFMIPSYFVELTALPLTPSGKIDRKALPEPLDHKITAAGYMGPENHLQEQLVEIWSEVLNIDKNRISIDSNFFEIGGHSLKATVLMSKMHKEMNVKVTLAEIFKTPTIRGLSRHIPGTERENFISIEPVEKKEHYQLSPAQKRLYILQQMEAVYNMNAAWVLKGVLGKKQLEETFNRLIRRHESLRTSFQMIDDEPIQEIHEDFDFEIEYFDFKIAQVEVKVKEERSSANRKRLEGTRGLAPLSIDLATRNPQPVTRTIKNFIRPFDLSHAPLLRIGLIKIDIKKHILMLDMHHIISDGISLGIFIKEFTAVYEGRDLPGLRLQYKDYSEWQKRENQREVIKKQEEYWMKQFDTEAPVLELPVDYPRPEFQGFEGRTLFFQVGKKETWALKSLANNEDATFYMVLLASLNVLLAKLSGNEDIAVGTPIAGRRHMDLQPIIGMFVGTLVMRNYPDPLKTAAQFIQEVKERTLAAFENQDYQFENLVEKIVVNRNTGRNPLFDVMFAVQNIDLPGFEIEGLELEPYDYESGVANFDLFLQVFEKEEILTFSLNYCTKLFKEETVKLFITYFKKILSFLIESPLNPGKKISEIEIIPEKEKRKILYDFNNTRTAYPGDKTIHGLFEEQAEKNPDNIAVHGCMNAWMNEEGHITYRELNEKANQLACLLKAKGVQPDIIVGIMAERSIEMVIGLLGILKAGGAYLPLDPEYPQERIKYMLKDSAAKILVTAPGLTEKFEKLLIVNCQLLIVNEMPPKRRRLNNPPKEANSINNYQLTIHNSQLESANLAYIIYTSGSTGSPKGSTIPHKGISNRLHWMQDAFRLNSNDRVLQKTPFSFDVSVWEFFWPLLTGAGLVMAEPGGHKDPSYLVEVINRERITTLHFVPPMLNAFLEDPGIHSITTLKRVICSGEALPEVYQQRFFKSFPAATQLHNLYGPTEASVDVTAWHCQQQSQLNTVPLGKPIANTQIYILDRNLNPVPIGVHGELYIGGIQLARGYLNNPELTADRFCPRRPGGTLFEKNAPPGPPRKNFSLKRVPDRNYYMSHRSYMSYIYRTGDLARWLPDGNIEFLGRLDFQVKIRGFRIELGEIESKLRSHPFIEEAVVIAVENITTPGESEKKLAAYIVFNSSLSAASAKMEELRAYLSGKLPGFMIPSFFVPLENLPLTTSGKVDRKALPKLEAAVPDEGTYTPPGSQMEKRLVALWVEIIGIKKEMIGIDADFFKLGGHSLQAVRLIARIHREFNIRIPLKILFKVTTIRGLSRYIEGEVKEVYISTAPVEKKKYYPVSSIQKRLFILDQVGDIKTAYNLPHALIVEGEAGVDIQRFQRTFHLLIKRHESLRTSFTVIDNEPVQIVHKSVDFCMGYCEAEESEVHGLIDEFITPFDLSKAPLLRAKLIKLSGKKYLFLYDMHHIISDGTSTGIFLKDFTRLYKREELPGLSIQYKDFSEGQNSSHERVRSILKQKEKYWLDRFKGEIPKLNIYTDYPRPPVQSFAGDQIQFTFEKEWYQKVHQLMKETNTTLYLVLLAFYNILLARYTGQEDIIIGTPSAGREQVDVENVIGLFMNALPMRNYPRANKTFKEFLEEVKNNSIEAFENQGYPFGDLVEKVAVIDDLSRNPIYEAELLVQNMEIPEWEIKNLKFTPYEYVYPVTQVDIALEAVESGEVIFFTLRYSTALFKRSTMEKFVNSFRQIVSVVIDKPFIKLGDIKISHRLLSLQSNVYQENQMDFEF
jgi:amino acid adenylation domain-containing protein